VDFDFVYSVAGTGLCAVGVIILLRAHKTSTILSILVLDIFSVMIPSVFVATLYFLPPEAEFIAGIAWDIVLIGAFLGYGTLYQIILTHNPSVHGTARTFTFLVLLTIAIVWAPTNSGLVLTYQEQEFNAIPGAWFLIISLVFFSYLTWEVLRYSGRILHYARRHKGKPALFLFLGVLLVTICPVLMFILPSFLPSLNTDVVIPPDGVGIIFLAVALQLDPSIPFLLPDKLIELIIFDKTGRQIISYRFQDVIPEIENKSGVLISLNGLMSSLVGGEGSIEEIKLKDRHVLFHCERDQGFFVILTSTVIYPVLKKIIREFAQEFGSIYAAELSRLQNPETPFDAADFKDAGELILKWFSKVKVPV